MANVENGMNEVHDAKQFSTHLAFESFFGRQINVSFQTK